MAKKLFTNDYTFQVAAKQLILAGRVKLDKLLLVTNLTTNQIIYNFADPSKGITEEVYDQDAELTQYSLKADLTGQNDTDKLQIFVEGLATAITPSEDLMDAVGKLRVSTPGNLIDTDFEYGTQSTKWETIQSVNNLPTIYSSSGDLPLSDVLEVYALDGSNQIKVSTDTPHGLAIGNPITVQGLSIYQAEGSFLVTGVPDGFTFYFEIDIPSNTTGDISGSYTTIVPGKFYEGSNLNTADESPGTTDGAEPSKLLITTAEAHGFNAGTKVYLKNTIGPKKLSVFNPDDIAIDGRPNVDTVPFFITNATVDASIDTGRTGALVGPVVSYDWECTYTRYLFPNDIDPVLDRISWPGHNLYDGATLLFNTPRKGDTDAGLVDGEIYYVKIIDADYFQVDTVYRRNPFQARPLFALNNTYGQARFGLVYMVSGSLGGLRYPSWNIINNPVIPKSPAFSRGYTDNTSREIFYSITASLIDEFEVGAIAQITQALITSYSISGTTSATNLFIRIRGQNGNPDVTIWNGRGSSTITPTDADYQGCLFLTGGVVQFIIDVTSYSYSSYSVWIWNPQGSRTYWRHYGFNLTLNTDVYYTVPNADDFYSGKDLVNLEYGLGGVEPQAVIAFQNQTAGQLYDSTDNYSYQVGTQNERDRFGTISPRSAYATITDIDAVLGTFSLSDAGSNYRDTDGISDAYYAFINFLPNNRNTIYIPSHGFTSGDTVSIEIDATDYANGQRFQYADSAGAPTPIATQIFEALVITIDPDNARFQVNVAPFTDDVCSFPQNFTVTYRQNNDFYNTIYVNNHKVTGTTQAVYSKRGTSGEIYNVSAEFDNSAYIFSSVSLGSGNKNPTLSIYRGQTYTFNISALGHPFEFWDDTFSSTYTDGVTGTPTDNGQITFVVPGTAPNTLKYRCQNHFNMQGTINVLDQSTDIGGLVTGTTYLLDRINDSRLLINSLNVSSSSAFTDAAGATNNAVLTVFIDVETPLLAAGLTAVDACSITDIQYRGDFGGKNEYAVVTFTFDQDKFQIGANAPSNTSVFLSDESFTFKNVTPNLYTDPGTGKIGFEVQIAPTTQINRAPSGMVNWWEIRFEVIGDSGSVTLSTGGSGWHDFRLAPNRGAYDGIFDIISVPSASSFELDAPFQIPLREYTLVPSATATATTISFSDPHNLRRGEKLYYTPAAGDNALVTTDDGYVFVVPVSETQISLSDSYFNAINNITNPLDNSGVGTHALSSDSVIKNTRGLGSLAITAGSNVIVGTGTSFLTDFKRFDNLFIETGGQIQTFIVNQITTDELMTIFDPVGQSGTGVKYYFETQLILRPDGYSLHLSFDGGVDITAGTSPNSRIVRQTRKYFRYQSGKGIQNSVAINFNPPKIMQTLITSSGNIALVTTQEAHNLNVGEEIRIDGAEVDAGNNEYNGIFTVATVPSPFQFTYEMANNPIQLKSGGFPTYVRTGWTDSYVRTGMFDDQNGFFWEYDGSVINAVRRSSTKQIAGTVDTIRGSQVIRGTGTSFTTQLKVGEKVVIRGQSYRIVEIGSDIRMTVQPPYRGLAATKVKVTKTEDVRTSQTNWNLDKCDGEGPSGFLLDSTKIQMAYFDYSWYGAGKIRYGWKDQNGHVMYAHEYKHNNRLNESYFRSGNLPGRYEIENGSNPTTSPTLFHFGTSVIMDGRFDDDKAYLFTVQSRPHAYTSGENFTYTQAAQTSSTFELVTLKGSRVWVYAFPLAPTELAQLTVGMEVQADTGELPEATYVTQIANGQVYTNYPASSNLPALPTIQPGTVYTFGDPNGGIDLTRPLPLVSVRLAPSVDSSLTGAVGEREIINRMQLGLKQAGVTANQDMSVFLILNSLPSRMDFEKVQQPSLSELIEHVSGDTLLDGTTILATKASAGSQEIDLTQLLEMGNSVLGGDGIYPAGPDLLTIAVQPATTQGVTAATPFTVSAKISWSESQA